MAASELVQAASSDRRERAALLRQDASRHYATERSVDTAHRFALDALVGLIDARAALLCEWDGAAFARRVLAGADVDTDLVDERVEVVRRPLLGLDHLAEPSEEVVRVLSASAAKLDVGDLLGDLSDELVIAVAGPSAQPPICVVVLAGLDTELDADRSFILRDFTLTIMGVMMIESVDRQRRRADERRVAAMEALVDEVDAERRRISHEIHDDVLQSVTSIAHFLETLTENTASEQDRSLLERLRVEAQNAAITLRQVVDRFEPAQHREEQLSAQIRQLTDKVAGELDIVIAVDLDDGVDDLPVAHPIMRVVRQALDNVVAHAAATEVHVSLTIDDDALLSITDDGIGIEQPAPWTSGVGMRSMRNVVTDHGGRFEVRNPPDGGTELIATFPMRQRPSPSTLRSGGTNGDADDIVGRAHGATLALLEQGRHVTISAVAGLAGIDRRRLLFRYPTAQELVNEAEADLVASVLERWAAFDPIDVETSLEDRIDLLLDRRFEMEVWGRPTRNRTTPVDPTSRFDTEVLAAFAPELEAMTPTNRENRGHVVAWLLRTRSIRAFLGEATDPVTVRSSLRFVAMALLSNDP